MLAFKMKLNNKVDVKADESSGGKFGGFGASEVIVPLYNKMI